MINRQRFRDVDLYLFALINLFYNFPLLFRNFSQRLSLFEYNLGWPLCKTTGRKIQGYGIRLKIPFKKWLVRWIRYWKDVYFFLCGPVCAARNLFDSWCIYFCDGFLLFNSNKLLEWNQMKKIRNKLVTWLQMKRIRSQTTSIPSESSKFSNFPFPLESERVTKQAVGSNLFI